MTDFDDRSIDTDQLFLSASIGPLTHTDLVLDPDALSRLVDFVGHFTVVDHHY